MGGGTKMATRALLVVPEFNRHSFWSYEGVRDELGVRYAASPLGIITLAALLPASWELKLINRNTEELTEADLAWADLLMTGGMLSQQFDMLELIELSRKRGLPVAVGGPDPTSSPEIYARADFIVSGEAEGILDRFVEAFESGARQGRFEAERFKADVTRSPIPRFDLLKLDQYLYVGMQFSRGCPFTCEFCDIIELYGRNPRTKTPEQMLAELDCLYDLGYRGHVDFVDDNLIGNKKAVKAFLPHLIAWQKRRSYPFMLTTEASLNIADDPALMAMMRDANFIGFFCGIESPDPETLRQTSKKQNLKHDIATSIHRIYEHGMFVIPGFVIGFDAESEGVTEGLIQCLEEADLPVGMLSLLYALPGTQLTRRLEKEGRLHAGVGQDRDRKQGDFSLAGLNFVTKRPRDRILRDFVAVLEHMYEPKGYFARMRRAIIPMQRVRLPLWILLRDSWREIDRFRRLMTSITLHRPEIRWKAWAAVMECLIRNPRAVRNVVSMVVFFYFAQPLSRIWIRKALRRAHAEATPELVAVG